MGLDRRTPVADPALLGTWRSLAPPGAMPHIAERLDATSPANDYEAEVEVEMLNIDATSFRQLSRSYRTPQAIASAIEKIVAERGKMQNPVTGSGGVLVGRLGRLGEARTLDAPTGGAPSGETRTGEVPAGEASLGGASLGQRVVPLASLIATPLRLDSVGPVDPSDPQVPASGRAIVTGLMPCAVVPDDLPLEVVLTALDVYPAASHTKALAREGGHVAVIGSGHAGLAAVAAAREQVGPGGLVTVVDMSEQALELARSVDPAVATIAGDATEPVAVAARFEELGLPRADLTLLCATVAGCEGTAILLTSNQGTVLFFSTATSFSAAALGADSLSSLAGLVIPNGYTPDGGSYLLDLLRRTPTLLASFSRRRS